MHCEHCFFFFPSLFSNETTLLCCSTTFRRNGFCETTKTRTQSLCWSWKQPDLWLVTSSTDRAGCTGKPWFAFTVFSFKRHLIGTIKRNTNWDSCDPRAAMNEGTTPRVTQWSRPEKHPLKTNNIYPSLWLELQYICICWDLSSHCWLKKKRQGVYVQREKHVS